MAALGVPGRGPTRDGERVSYPPVNSYIDRASHSSSFTCYELLRFPFGRNWKAYLNLVTEDRVIDSQSALAAMLDKSTLGGRSFLDVGSGSGLSSLAAIRLGASRVLSFDYDEDSVECTRELKRRFSPTSTNWSIEQGSALDERYMERLGPWDIVYSWGVLHHTGNMKQAFENVCRPVAPGGTLFISIYNDQGKTSIRWTRIKSLYNSSRIARWIILLVFIPYYAVRAAITALLRPIRRRSVPPNERGMTPLVGWLDWLGGYPFEVATPDEIRDFFTGRGFTLERLNSRVGTIGCNEFVFRKGSVGTQEGLRPHSSGAEAALKKG